MLAKEHPGLADVILTLLKGNLFSNRIGLISHWVLCRCIGIYGACDPGGRQWGPDVLHGWTGGLKGLLIRTLCFFGISEWIVMVFQWNVLRTLPSASLLKDLEKADCSSGVS